MCDQDITGEQTLEVCQKYLLVKILCLSPKVIFGDLLISSSAENFWPTFKTWLLFLNQT